ncbi:thioredoxin family protein [Lentibacillus cibarius]|uniref:Thioredoxin family protein n=1 Tax=Lentibacillus cibarius TaxID=2583219 RepID=A0A5S3QH66_9BACI|nr:thioredoxin family protein [Lentibacillus cibarius]TMN21242.1 thioredoxin family protein [Lentibacillus cibarius]
MTLEQWFEQGMDPDTYIESMQKNKENLLHIYDHFTLPEDEQFIRNLAAHDLRVIVLTEDWCGDAMLNTPILLRLTEQADIPVKFLPRDENLELMDQYLTNGTSRSIPKFIFIDSNGKEVAVWGPRAEEIQEFVDHSRQQLPPSDHDDYKEKSKEIRRFMTKSFRDNTDFWQEVYESIKTTLKRNLNL